VWIIIASDTCQSLFSTCLNLQLLLNTEYNKSAKLLPLMTALLVVLLTKNYQPIVLPSAIIYGSWCGLAMSHITLHSSQCYLTAQFASRRSYGVVYVTYTKYERHLSRYGLLIATPKINHYQLHMQRALQCSGRQAIVLTYFW